MTIFRFSIFMILALQPLNSGTAFAKDTLVDGSFRNALVLREYCSANPGEKDALYKMSSCGSFIIGVVDAHAQFRALYHTERHYCIPRDAMSGTVIEKARRWIVASQYIENMSGAQLVTHALTQVFPCKEAK